MALASGIHTEPLASAPDPVEVAAETLGEVLVATELAEMEPLMVENTDAFFDIFELDDDSADEEDPDVALFDDEVPDEDSIRVGVDEAAEVLIPPAEVRIEEEIEEEIEEPTVEIGVVDFVEEETPPPLIELPAQDLHADDARVETGVPESHQPELVVSTMPEKEHLRELPLFLDDADDFVPRIPTLSERDADRALIALAEARSKAEQGGLLRGQRTPVDEVVVESEAAVPESVDEVAVESETPDPDSGEEVPEEALPEFEVTSEEPVSEPPPEEIEPEVESGTLSDRIERFVALARSELGATAAAVSDRDGFLLFLQSEREGDEEMETALLLEVAGKADRLLGVEHGSATQVSTDGGAWRCLIRGGEGANDLYAGFRLRRPLDQEEIVRWRNALAEVISPTLELR